MKINKTILPNGLRIITVPMLDNPSVTVLVMVSAGSKYETKKINGLSHFLEHMVFKGTTRRPKAVDISRELDSLGASYNAFTGQEYTGYYAKVAARHLDKALDIVSDMYVNPIFDTAEIEKEKGVIVEELRMYKDLPQHQAAEMFTEALYGDQPAGWPIIGTEDTIRSFSRADLIAYRSAHYVASATTVIVSGSFDESTIIADIEKSFSAISTGDKAGKLPVHESQSSPEVKLTFKETDQTHLVLGVRTFPIFDPRMPIMRVLSAILGKSMSSRLWTKMREELGICYYVNADQDSYTDHGVLAISAGVDNTRVEQAIKGILGECARLRDEFVSEAELQKVKDYIAGTTVLHLETSDARAEYCGYQEVLKNKVDMPEEGIAKVRAVTAEQVRELARQVFVDTQLTLSIVGKYKDPSAFSAYLTF